MLRSNLRDRGFVDLRPLSSRTYGDHPERLLRKRLFDRAPQSWRYLGVACTRRSGAQADRHGHDPDEGRQTHNPTWQSMHESIMPDRS